MMRDVLVILAGYLLGSIPFAFLVTKAIAGKDIRLEGEGNVGARNVLHAVGPLAGLLVFLLDGTKGAITYWLAHSWASGGLAFYLTAFALMLGHGFPVWLGWRGGKGLSAAIGFLLQMWPCSVLGAAVIYLVLRWAFSGFILRFAIASAAFPLFTLLEGNNFEGLAFIACLLGLAGLKKAVDLPHERATQARSGWVDEPVGLRWRIRSGKS